MAITTELKKIYSDYDDSRRFYDTVQLYHPSFDTSDVYPSETSYPSLTSYPLEIDYLAFSYFLVRDTSDHTFNVDGVADKLFTAYPFNVIQPQVGEDQQDIGIVFDNVSLELLDNIESASQNTSVPIQMTFRVYMDGDTTTQITPIIMSLTEVVVDMHTVSCKASRIDLFKRKFPFGENTYFNENFKGLLL